MMLPSASFITAESVFGSFVGCEVHSMRRPYVASVSKYCDCRIPYEPAPKMTLDSPFHSVLIPSTREMVTIALDMPVYMAVGEGLTTCIRV
jgi:hypothetical protein